MKDSYHIEYDLPFDHTGDPKEIVNTLAGYIEYIMDDIIHDLGMERYQILFYYLTDTLILDMIRKLTTREEKK